MHRSSIRCAFAIVFCLTTGCFDQQGDFEPRDWQQVRSGAPWGIRDAGSVAVHDGKMWVLGGWTYDQVSGDTTIFTDAWSSADGNEWQEHATPAWTFGMYTRAVSFKSNLLVMGGLKNSRQPNEELTNEVWSSKGGDSWQLLGHAQWEPRIGFSLLTRGQEMWVLGGKTRNNGDHANLRNDVWKSSDGVHWKLVTANAPWQPRAFHCAFVHDDEIWVMGGGDWDSRFALNDVWHSRDGVSWTREDDAPWKGRIWQSCVSYQGAIWVMGGRTFEPLATDDEVWRSSNGNEWEFLSQTVRPDSRHAAYTAVFEGGIWTMGGSANGYLHDDVWRYQGNQ